MTLVGTNFIRVYSNLKFTLKKLTKVGSIEWRLTNLRLETKLLNFDHASWRWAWTICVSIKTLKNNKQNNKLNSPVLFTLGAGPNLMWGLSTPLNTRTCVVAASTAPSGRDRYQKDSELHLRRILCSSTISINQHIQQSINLSIYQSSISNISIN